MAKRKKYMTKKRKKKDKLTVFIIFLISAACVGAFVYMFMKNMSLITK